MTISRRKILAYGAGAAGVLAAPAIVRAQAAPIRLVFSHHLPVTHLGHKITETFAARVKEATSGRISIVTWPLVASLTLAANVSVILWPRCVTGR